MKSIKLMLLGVALMLASIFIQGEPGINLYDGEVFIGLLGLILTFIGFIMGTKKD